MFGHQPIGPHVDVAISLIILDTEFFLPGIVGTVFQLRGKVDKVARQLIDLF